MLQIGTRSYQLVRGQSGLHVSLDPNEREPWQQQVWRFDAHFVPGDEDCGPELDQPPWEYWQLTINPMAFFRIADWRELARGSFMEGEGADRFLFMPNVENLIGPGGGRNPVRDVSFDDFRIVIRDGWLFTCELEGEIAAAKEDEAATVAGAFRLVEEIPFATARVAVPLNAGDPLATARAIAAREIGLMQIARSSVDLYDPGRKVWNPTRSGKHMVLLETPWRMNPA